MAGVLWKNIGRQRDIMKKIHFATTNRGKIYSMQSILGEYAIEVVPVSLELYEPRSDDIRVIAKQKVLQAYSRIQRPVVAQDAGFCIYALNGWPGSFINHELTKIGLEGFLRLAHEKARECEFRNCLAYYDGKTEETILFESNTEGLLSDAPKGESQNYFWSELFHIFIPKGETKTLAEMAPEEYEVWRKVRRDDSFANKFGEWYSKYNE